MQFLRQTLTVAAKDLRSELRTKEAVNASLSFALVILILFSFAFDPTAETTREIAGGLLWLVFAFAGVLVLNRSFAANCPTIVWKRWSVRRSRAALFWQGTGKLRPATGN